MEKAKLNILISAHELNPYGGSECAEGWNVVTRLGKYHNITVLYASGSQFNPNSYEMALQKYFSTHENSYNITFIAIPQPGITNFISFINRKISRNQSIGNSFLYYFGYSFWQRKAYEVAKELCKKNRFDIVHHLTSISFREPGLLWKLKIPFVWGPTGGMAGLPSQFYKSLGTKTYMKEIVRNKVNYIQFFYNGRIKNALNNSSLIYTFTKVDEFYFSKRTRRKPKILLDAATLPSINENIHIKDQVSFPLQLVWCGELIQRKSLDIIIHAINSEPMLHDKIILNVIGAGPLENTYKFLAESLGISSCINWFGKVERTVVFDIMKKSDILVHSSYREGASHVILEALSHGLCVICHDINGMSIAVDDNSGIKVPLISPEKSIQGFKEAMMKMVNNPDELVRLKKGAYSRSKELSWDKMAETISNDYIDIYESNKKG